MFTLQIVGITTQQEVYAASRERTFRINELVLIKDIVHDQPLAEVVETQSFNRFIPLATERSQLVDRQVLDNLAQLGYDIGGETIHLARLRIVGELTAPITVGVSVEVPSFGQVREMLVPKDPGAGLVLGVIRGTEELTNDLPPALSQVAPLYFKEQGVLPQVGAPFILDHWTLPEYPHIGIFGGSGSGKSFGLRVLLEELMRQELPALVLDPHFELSFERPFPGVVAPDFSHRSRVFIAGRNVGILFEELEQGELSSLLQAAGEVTEHMHNAIRTLHHRGDTLAKFQNRLQALIRGLEEERDLKRRLENGGFSDDRERQEAAQMLGLVEKYKDKVGHVSTLGAISRRLHRLQLEKVFSHGIEPIREAIMDRKLVVVQGPVWFLQVLGGYVIRKFYRQRRQYRDAQQTGEKAAAFPPFLVVTDEAHNFAPRSPELMAPARSIMRTIAQEGRKYGVFLILATQRPALLDDTITAQLNTKIIFRTVRSSDLDVIREETDLAGEEIKRLPYLSSGNAFVSSATLGRTVAVRIRAAYTASPHNRHSFTELGEDFRTVGDQLRQLVLGALPLGDFNFDVHLGSFQEALGTRVTVQQVRQVLEELVASGEVVKEELVFGMEYRPSQ